MSEQRKSLTRLFYDLEKTPLDKRTRESVVNSTSKAETVGLFRRLQKSAEHAKIVSN